MGRERLCRTYGKGAPTVVDLSLAEEILVGRAAEQSGDAGDGEKGGETDGGAGGDGAALLARLATLGARLAAAPDAEALKLADEAVLATWAGSVAAQRDGGGA